MSETNSVTGKHKKTGQGSGSTHQESRADKRQRSSSLQPSNQRAMFRPASGVLPSTSRPTETNHALSPSYFSGRLREKPSSLGFEIEGAKGLKASKQNPFLDCIKNMHFQHKQRHFNSVDVASTAKNKQSKHKPNIDRVLALLQDQRGVKLGKGGNTVQMGFSQVRQGSLPSPIPIPKGAVPLTSRFEIGRKRSSQVSPPKHSKTPGGVGGSQLPLPKKKKSRGVSPVMVDVSKLKEQPPKPKKSRTGRTLPSQEPVVQPKTREHTEFSYKKNVNGVFLSSSFLLDNELLEADLSKSLGNIWPGGEFATRKAASGEESSSPDKGAEFKIHEVMAAIDPRDPESIVRHWTDALYVLKQDYLRLSYPRRRGE